MKKSAKVDMTRFPPGINYNYRAATEEITSGLNRQFRFALKYRIKQRAGFPGHTSPFFIRSRGREYIFLNSII
jgi:hypothetical protein